MLKELVKVANKLDALGLTKEADFIDALLNKKASMEDEEPPIDIDVLKEAYQEHTKKMLSGIASLDVTKLYWTTIQHQHSSYSCYVVESEGKWDDGNPFKLDGEIWLVPESYSSRFTFTVKGKDGNLYYLYAEY